MLYIQVHSRLPMTACLFSCSSYYDTKVFPLPILRVPHHSLAALTGDTKRVSRREGIDAVNQLYEVGRQHGPAMDALEVNANGPPCREQC